MFHCRNNSLQQKSRLVLHFQMINLLLKFLCGYWQLVSRGHGGAAEDIMDEGALHKDGIIENKSFISSYSFCKKTLNFPACFSSKFEMVEGMEATLKCPMRVETRGLLPQLLLVFTSTYSATSLLWFWWFEDEILN